MFKITKISAAALIVLGASSAFAQDDAAQLERVTVTGSAIKRIDAETSVPVTIVKMADLKKAGVTSVEQVMATLSSVQIQNNAAQSIGSGSGGSTFADMRGIGADKTLVLLNGQRIANNAVDGSAPDLNMIPFAAIERIEVLRDGASSLYGTDAIGGVINFITRNDLRGGSITIGYDSPQHPGGKGTSASASFGFGDLETQNFNLFGTLSYRRQDSIDGLQRDFNKRIVGGTSSSTLPANYGQDGKLYNDLAPDCVGTALIPSGTQCKLVTPAYVDFSPKSETFSGLFKGTIRLSNSLNIGGELFLSRNSVTTQVAPVPYGGYLVNPGTTYYKNNSTFSPTFDDGYAGAPAFNPTTAFPNPVNVLPGYEYVYWRDFPNGSRQQTNKNSQQRALLTADGSAGGWDYSVVASYNHNKVDQWLTGGYGDGDIIGEGLLEGIINPFGDQTAAGTALLQSAALNGLLQTASGKVASINAHASRELGDWFNASRPAQLALGVETRHEKFISVPLHDYAEKVYASTGVDPNFHSEGSRNVQAVYGELNVPVLKTLDITASLRYDKYSDFGNTTNPKVSFRFQPMKELLVRGSLSTGFRAPTLYELYGNKSFTNTAGSYDNPILDCSNEANVQQCDTQFQVQNGGNAKLKPEKSKSATLGVVFEPMSNASLGADFWWVRIKDSIAAIPQSTLFSQYDQFQQYFHFNAASRLSTTSVCPGSNCGYVDQGLLNLGGTNTNGIDLSAQYRLRTSAGQFDFALNSTYVMKYEYQDYADGPWNQNVGVYSGAGPIFRWQHNLNVGWSKDAWSAGATVHYKSGYLDFDPSNTVKAYTTTDLFVGFAPIKSVNLVLGVRNVFDKEPPFTNQADLFQAGGWDSRYADPTGRAYYARATYNF